MGFKTVLIGFLFLINPDYFTFDLLPDLFGYLLIARGLYRLSFLEDRIWQARRLTRILALVSFLKLLSNLFSLTTNVESTRLTVMFLFATVEGFLGYLAADNLFKGIQYLAVRRNSDIAFKGLDVASVFTRAFIIAKNVFAFLPAALILFYSDVDADPELVEGYASLRHGYMTVRMVLMALCSLAILGFGIYTAVILRAYLKRVRSDAAFIQRLREEYDAKVTNNRDALVRIHVRESFGTFLIAALFLPDLYVDHFGLLPTFVAGILILLGLSNLAKGHELFARWVKKTRWIVWCATGVSLSAYVYRLVCLIVWDEKFQKAFWGGVPSVIFGIADGVFVLALFGVVLTLVIRVCRQETEVPYRLSSVFTALLWLAIVGCAVFGYVYPGRNGVVQAVQIALAGVSFYLFWRKTDQIKAEVDYRRM